MTNRKQISPMTPQDATNLAIFAVQHLSGDNELLSRFVALSGIDPSELRQIADSDAFMIAVLDFFMADEPSLLAFAASRGLNPADISKARAILEPNQPLEEWT